VAHATNKHRAAEKSHNKKYKQLVNNGVLSEALLPVLWEDYKEHIPTLLLMMIKVCKLLDRCVVVWWR
jgi:hypothetical protein